MPPAVSHTRGCGFPLRASIVTVFSTTAPSRSTSSTVSMRAPNVPEATITGLASSSGPARTDRSTAGAAPLGRWGGGVFGARGFRLRGIARRLLLSEEYHLGDEQRHPNADRRVGD